MEQRSAVRRTFVATGFLLAAAGASAILAYKVSQGRAADCGEVEKCFGNVAATRAFAVMTFADLLLSVVCVAQCTSDRAWALA